MADSVQPDPVVICDGLRKVRTTRWILWATIFIYIPGLFVVLQLKLSSGSMSALFGLWVALLCIAVGLATVVKCPNCRKPFHTHGPTFLPVRKCVHCGLHVNADRSVKTP